MLSGEIEDGMAASIVAQLLFLEAEDPDKDNDPSETTSSSLNETSTTPTASKPRIESIETE